ncbi:MAG: hypothetical protein ACJAT2_001213 [Bacteriovoracaceae bacterium]|jgi:hypothetical protein
MKILILAWAMLYSVNSQADVKMLYSEDTPFSLGNSYDLDLPFSRKENCLTYESVRWADVQDGVVKMSFGSKLITESSDLTKNLSVGVDLAAKAKFKLISANANMSAKLIKNYHSYQDSLSYLVQAKYNFGKKELLNPVLKEKYQALINEGKHQEFIKRCGTHFVENTDQKVVLNVMLTMSKLNSEKKKDLTVAFGGDVAYGGFSGSLKTSLEKNYNLAKKYGQTSLSVTTLGGSSTSMNEFGASDDLQKTLNAMKELMRGVNKNTSTAVGFSFVSMERFGLEVPAYDHRRQEFLNKAFLLSLEYENKIRRLKKEVESLRKIPTDRVEKSIAYFQSAQRNFGREYRKMESIVNRCLLEGRCQLEELLVINFKVDWPTDFIRNPRLRSVCYYSERGLDSYTKFVEGDLLHGDLIRKVNFVKTSTSGRYLLPFGYHDLTFSERLDRFAGVIERNSKFESELYLDDLFNADYKMIVTDHMGSEQSYSLDQYDFGNCEKREI